MTDIHFGSRDSRELTLRLFAPWQMRESTDHGWQFAWRKLFSPVAWWRSLWRGEWRVEWWRHPNSNHRCYCPVGLLFDGRIVLGGFGLIWFYSRYGGPVPCPCDEAFEEIFCEEEVSVRNKLDERKARHA